MINARLAIVRGNYERYIYILYSWEIDKIRKYSFEVFDSQLNGDQILTNNKFYSSCAVARDAALDFIDELED